MKRPLLSLIILLSAAVFFPFHARAQRKIEGTIVDQQGSPVAYGTVSFKQAGSDQKVQQIDSLGRFSFKNVGSTPAQLTIYVFGYNKKTLTIQPQHGTFLTITLEPLSSNLDAITVTGNKASVRRETGRVVFNVEENISTAGSAGLNLLREIPGIHVNNQTISLAGKGNMGVMINGRLLHLSDKALVNYLRSFSANQIDKIEIITHPGAKYDAEGAAGLINIVTRESPDAGWGGSVSSSVKRFFFTDQPHYDGVKNYGDINESVNLHYSSKKWSAYTNMTYINGRELWGYGIGVHYADKFWDMSDKGKYRIPTFNLLAGVNYKLSDKTAIGGEYTYAIHTETGADHVRVPVYDTNGSLDSLLRTYATYHPIAKSNGINLHLEQKLNESGAKMLLNADYFSFYRTDESNLTTKSYAPDLNLKPGSIKKLYDNNLQDIDIYTFKADFVYPTPVARITFGGKLSFINIYSNIYYYHKKSSNLVYDKGLSNEFQYIENTQALYISASRDLDKWELQAGLRAEPTQTKAISYFEDSRIRQKYLRLFPSVLATYHLNEDNQLSLTYSKRIHRPTFWNMNPYKTFMTAYSYVEGNPYLEPEYINNIQLSHRYKQKLTTSVYTNIINNGFAQVIQPQAGSKNAPVTTMLNFIDANRYGMSEAISLNPFRWWESRTLLRGYYTHVHSNITSSGGIEGWGGYISTTNTFYFNDDRTFSGFLSFWYQFPEIVNFGRSSSYYNVNAGLQLHALQKKLTLSLNYSDIFQSSAPALTSVVQNFKTTYTNFQLHSQLRFSVVWHFGRGNVQKTAPGNEKERSRIN